jgi:TPR repeat protein
MEKENAALAVEYYQQAMSLDESNTDALFNMALLYYSKKEE